MNNNQLISIIVPVYKVEPYLEKCIQSIINQTYKNIEIILVNDASPDNCGNICDEYALKDSRIKVIHKEYNTGLSDTRNIGISRAIGEYIGFVDSDDYVNETMYENMYKLLIEKDADVCICNFYNVEGDKFSIKNPKKGIREYSKIEILKEILIDREIQSYAWNKLYKRTLFNNIKYPIGKKYEDIGTTFYLLEKCNKVVVSDEPEYYYLNRSDSIVNTTDEQTIMDYIDIINDRYDYIQKKYSDLKKYNIYCLAKILITAYADRFRLKSIEGKNDKKIHDLYNKVKSIMKEYESEVIELFNEEQKMQLYTLLYNPELYYYMIKNDKNIDNTQKTY